MELSGSILAPESAVFFSPHPSQVYLLLYLFGLLVVPIFMMATISRLFLPLSAAMNITKEGFCEVCL